MSFYRCKTEWFCDSEAKTKQCVSYIYRNVPRIGKNKLCKNASVKISTPFLHPQLLRELWNTRVYASCHDLSVMTLEKQLLCVNLGSVIRPSQKTNSPAFKTITNLPSCGFPIQLRLRDIMSCDLHASVSTWQHNKKRTDQVGFHWRLTRKKLRLY